MQDRTEADESELPDTGVTRELERRLSSTFILHPERMYGTLCSTALIVDTDRRCRFSEQNYDASGMPTAAHYYEFALQH